MPSQDLAGRVALVSGASSGIGASIAKRLLEAGATVHTVSRRTDPVVALDPEAVREGRLVPHSLDVADHEAAERLFQELGASSPISILACAAGTNIPDRRFHQLTHESFSQVMDTNLVGVFTLVRLALPQLRQTAGDVVIISSVSASWPDHTGAAYTASKAALLGLARGLSRDEHVNGVRVCSILPGIVDTAILDKRPSPPPREVRDWAIHPDDIAEAVHTVVTLPARTNIAEMTVAATRLQSLGNTQQATPELPESLRE